MIAATTVGHIQANQNKDTDRHQSETDWLRHEIDNDRKLLADRLYSTVDGLGPKNAHQNWDRQRRAYIGDVSVLVILDRLRKSNPREARYTSTWSRTSAHQAYIPVMPSLFPNLQIRDNPLGDCRTVAGGGGIAGEKGRYHCRPKSNHLQAYRVFKCCELSFESRVGLSLGTTSDPRRVYYLRSRPGMLDKRSRVALWTAAIGAFGTIFAGLETRTAPSPSPSMSQNVSVNVSHAQTETPKTVVMKTAPSKRNPEAPAPEQGSVVPEQRSKADPPTTKPEICALTSDHSPIHLVISGNMPGSDLYVDDQLCRKDVGYAENLDIALAKGDHDLKLRRGDNSCSTHVVSPSKERVTLTCE